MSEITGVTGGSASVHHVLLLGPDDDARRALHVMLDRVGKHVAAVAEIEGARSYLGNGHECDAVIAAGELAAQLVGKGEVPPVIAVVRPRDLTLAMQLLAAGVDDIVSDPLDELALALALRHVATLPRRTAVVAPLALIGDGEVMQTLRATIEQVAGTRSTVLILGESGTGKELVARAIHDASPRRGRRFVAINCAAIPAALLESELFGHRRGAFTDAVRDKPGLFEDADGGTLLLDEIGELPLALQAKLLRVLQEGEIRRVGDTASIKVDVRLIAATLRELAADVRDGRFREDLYYRLNVLPVVIPPLRERTEDIPELARFFAQRHAARHQLGRIELSDQALEMLVRQRWPGNVRELENVLERAVVLADGPTRGGATRVIDADYLKSVLNVQAPASPAGTSDGLSIKKATRQIEQELIRRALGVTQGNRTNAAKLLEISHRALLYKMKEYGIS
ncbi:MAG TPA: sigma 54-interacting transcriptional regulator [Kofleriaceae bacterium]|jgi:two-component system response regulator AtoC|nr:sigma 54-interacting transcriptional regulator [Kofleriaceae bacterium]